MDNNGWNNGQNQNYQNQYEQNMYEQNPNGQNPYGQNGNRGRNGAGNSPMGITSMVLGILSLVLTCCCYLMSIPLGICAVVFGIVSIRKNEAQRGFAIAGIITGAIGFVLSVALFILARYLISTGIYDNMLNEFYHDLGIDPKHMLR